MKPLLVIERTITYRAYIAADLQDVHDIATTIDLSEQVTEDTDWTAYEAHGVEPNWWGACRMGRTTAVRVGRFSRTGAPTMRHRRNTVQRTPTNW